MPSLEVSELLCDPEFLSVITRLRPTTADISGSEGRTRTTYTSTPNIYAIVQPTGRPDEMGPTPEGERMDSWIKVDSLTEILMAEPDTVSDVVVWNGGKYRVMKVERYEAYGYYSAFAQEYHADTPTAPDPVEEGGT